MAVLSATDRTRTLAQWMREQTESAGFSKPQAVAALAAADDWVESNLASFNTSLPPGFRNSASTTQKWLLLAFVLERRTGRLRAQED